MAISKCPDLKMTLKEGDLTFIQFFEMLVEHDWAKKGLNFTVVEDNKKVFMSFTTSAAKLRSTGSEDKKSAKKEKKLQKKQAKASKKLAKLEKQKEKAEKVARAEEDLAASKDPIRESSKEEDLKLSPTLEEEEEEEEGAYPYGGEAVVTTPRKQLQVTDSPLVSWDPDHSLSPCSPLGETFDLGGEEETKTRQDKQIKSHKLARENQNQNQNQKRAPESGKGKPKEPPPPPPPPVIEEWMPQAFMEKMELLDEALNLDQPRF